MYFVKLPFGEWVNLAQVLAVEVEEPDDSLVPNINHLIVRLLFDQGKLKAYSGVKAVALLEALHQTAYIDKSQVGVRST